MWGVDDQSPLDRYGTTWVQFWNSSWLKHLLTQKSSNSLTQYDSLKSCYIWKCKVLTIQVGYYQSQLISALVIKISDPYFYRQTFSQTLTANDTSIEQSFLHIETNILTIVYGKHQNNFQKGCWKVIGYNKFEKVEILNLFKFE